MQTDCYFAFGGTQGGSSLAAPGESSNESAGETLDVEGFDGSGGTGSLGLGAMAGGQSAAPATAAGATTSRQKPSRGIGIGIGVAAGAATAHRGMKRELSDSNLGGAAGWDGNDSGWAGMGGDARRSMSEQQKLERRVSVLCSIDVLLVNCSVSGCRFYCCASTNLAVVPTEAVNVYFDVPKQIGCDERFGSLFRPHLCRLRGEYKVS